MKDLIKEAVSRGESPSADDDLEDTIRAHETKVRVVGCGGAGCNTVSRLTEEGVIGAEAIAINTDAQHLLATRAPHKILIGKHLTKGLGAGSLPQVGERAALESEDALRDAIAGVDLVFATCGLGGGTGTGSIPVVSQIAKESGALTIAVTTLPFHVEGAIRMENAKAGLARLREAADTTIVVPNDKLLDVAPNLPMQKAFRVVDEVLMRSIKGITELITKPGIVNLDFADLRTIMRGGGVAMIGIGEAEGQGRCRRAMAEALKNPLLDVDLSKAKGCLVNVVGGESMTIGEAEQAVELIYNRIDPNARIIWGTNVDKRMGSRVRIMIVLTGVQSRQILGPRRGGKQARDLPEERFQVVGR